VAPSTQISNKASRIRWERVVAATVLLASLSTAGFQYLKNNEKKPLKNYYCTNQQVFTYKFTVDERVAQHFNSEAFRGLTVNPIYQMAVKQNVNSSIALDIANAYSKCNHGIIPPEVILGVIKTESNFNPNDVAYAGAKGIMQLLPETFNIYVEKYPELFSEGDIFNVQENVCAGILYLQESYQAWAQHTTNETEALDLAIGSYLMGVQGLKNLSDDPLQAIKSEQHFVSEYVERVKENARLYVSNEETLE